ncbi:hypothetical protein JCM8547_003472 [Rhodosporidiobolus lusitaniae]
MLSSLVPSLPSSRSPLLLLADLALSCTPESVTERLETLASVAVEAAESALPYAPDSFVNRLDTLASLATEFAEAAVPYAPTSVSRGLDVLSAAAAEIAEAAKQNKSASRRSTRSQGRKPALLLRRPRKAVPAVITLDAVPSFVRHRTTPVEEEQVVVTAPLVVVKPVAPTAEQDDDEDLFSSPPSPTSSVDPPSPPSSPASSTCSLFSADEPALSPARSSAYPVKLDILDSLLDLPATKRLSSTTRDLAYSRCLELIELEEAYELRFDATSTFPLSRAETSARLSRYHARLSREFDYHTQHLGATPSTHPSLFRQGPVRPKEQIVVKSRVAHAAAESTSSSRPDVPPSFSYLADLVSRRRQHSGCSTLTAADISPSTTFTSLSSIRRLLHLRRPSSLYRPKAIAHAKQKRSFPSRPFYHLVLHRNACNAKQAKERQEAEQGRRMQQLRVQQREKEQQKRDAQRRRAQQAPRPTLSLSSETGRMGRSRVEMGSKSSGRSSGRVVFV